MGGILMKKRRRTINKIVKIVIGIFIVLLICFFSLNYTVNNNISYVNSLKNNIEDNYKLGDDIKDINVYGGYYIISTDKEVIVLDNDFEEVVKENINKLSNNIDNYYLVYRTNKLMYEETVVKGKTLTYNYYDAYSYDYVSSIVLGR